MEWQDVFFSRCPYGIDLTFTVWSFISFWPWLSVQQNNCFLKFLGLSTIQFIVRCDCKLWRNHIIECEREMLSSCVCQGHRWHLFNQNNILDCNNNALRSPSTWGLRCSVTMSDDSRWRIWTHLYSSHSLIDILMCFSDNLFLNAHTVHFLINHVVSWYDSMFSYKHIRLIKLLRVHVHKSIFSYKYALAPEYAMILYKYTDRKAERIT